MDDRSVRDARGFDWQGWALPGLALLAAAALVVFTVLSPGSPGRSPSPSAPALGGDEHEVTTDEGVVSFRLEGADVVVRLAAGGSTTELGRVTAPFVASAPPGGTPALAGSSAFVMVCGAATGPTPRRYVFGHLDPGAEITYEGPEAVGHGASDGLFLFALLPDAPAAEVRIGEARGASVGFPADSFSRATTDGVRQPSGCFVYG